MAFASAGRPEVVDAIRDYMYYRESLKEEYLAGISEEYGMDYVESIDNADRLVETIRRAMDIKNFEVG